MYLNVPYNVMIQFTQNLLGRLVAFVVLCRPCQIHFHLLRIATWPQPQLGCAKKRR